MQEGAGVGLVVGHRYKVRLKPLEELISNGRLKRGDQDVPWLKPYLNGCVGVMVFDGCEFQDVDWGDGLGFLWCYELPKLKVLGELG